MSDDDLRNDPDVLAWCDARDDETREHQDASACDDCDAAREVA